MKPSKLAVVVTAATLMITPAFSETTPLPAGKAAGTHEAALLALGPIFWIGLAAAIIGITAAAGGFDNSKTTTTTGTGS